MNQSKDSVKSITLRGMLVFDRCNNLCGSDRFGDQYHRQPDYNASFGRGRFRTVGHCFFGIFSLTGFILAVVAKIRRIW